LGRIAINCSDCIYFGWKTASGTGFSSPTVTYPNNTWFQVAGTWNGSVDSIYINGILNGSNPTTGGVPTGGNSFTSIGEAGYGGPPYQPFSGLISNVRIYNRALTAAQVAAMYNGGK
jgi:hypothetical protein